MVHEPHVHSVNVPIDVSRQFVVINALMEEYIRTCCSVTRVEDAFYRNDGETSMGDLTAQRAQAL